MPAAARLALGGKSNGGAKTVYAAEPVIWYGSPATNFAGGSGTQADPYLISNGRELAYLAGLALAVSCR